MDSDTKIEVQTHEERNDPVSAKEMLKDVIRGIDSSDKAIFATTFSSHLARLKTLIELGNQLNRKVVLLGRSLAKYVEAGEAVGIIEFTKEVELVKYPKHVKRAIAKIKGDPSGYFVICTGHQGEPKAMLSKLAKSGEIFKRGDSVIFSCKIIPSPVNMANRKELEDDLKSRGVRIFKDIHVSGHPGKEDLRELLEMLKPQQVIPCHGSIEFTKGLTELLSEMDYRTGEQIHVMQDGQRISL